MPDRRTVDELSIEELEQILRIRKRQARQERLRRLEEDGRRAPGAPITESLPNPDAPEMPYESFVHDEEQPERTKTLGDHLLLGVELLAVVGIVGVLVFAGLQLRNINEEAAEAQAAAPTVDIPTPTPTPIISAVVLPGGHKPPVNGQAEPNYDEVPPSLRPMVEQQFFAPVVAATPSPSQALQINIPSARVNNAPVVQGDGWEQLKKGVAQHIGTANPGEAGNMVLSAHNDIYGQIFRYLDELQPGDEIYVATQTQEFTYRVAYTRIVEPTEVSVMQPTREPIVTLISCYPYFVNTERIVVVGELVQP
jgi:sortase A